MASYVNESGRAIHSPDGKMVASGLPFNADPKNPAIKIWKKAGIIVESSQSVPKHKNLKEFSVREAKLIIASEIEIKVLKAWKEEDDRVTIKGLIDKRIDELK